MDQNSSSSWLEVSLTVAAELAEAVAEVLARHAPGGVVIESTAIEADPHGPGQPDGPLRVYAYLPADQHIEQARQQLEEDLWHLGCIQPLPQPIFTPFQNENWMENWKRHYHPIKVGRKLVILPPWLVNPQPSRTPILIDPGLAFGTGAHPTTRLSLQLLEHYLQPGITIFDIGCGSAILSIAAAKLGAAAVYGVDPDPQAIESARQNVISNDVQHQVELQQGSIEYFLHGNALQQQAPLVVANILSHILIKLLDGGLAALVEPGGILLLSGILEEVEGEMDDALARHKLNIVKRLHSEDWLALAVQPATED